MTRSMRNLPHTSLAATRRVRVEAISVSLALLVGCARSEGAPLSKSSGIAPDAGVARTAKMLDAGTVPEPAGSPAAGAIVPPKPFSGNCGEIQDNGGSVLPRLKPFEGESRASYLMTIDKIDWSDTPANAIWFMGLSGRAATGETPHLALGLRKPRALALSAGDRIRLMQQGQRSACSDGHERQYLIAGGILSEAGEPLFLTHFSTAFTKDGAVETSNDLLFGWTARWEPAGCLSSKGVPDSGAAIVLQNAGGQRVRADVRQPAQFRWRGHDYVLIVGHAKAASDERCGYGTFVIARTDFYLDTRP